MAYTINGGLNFGSAPAMNDYQGAYQNALSLNQQNYNNILAGYQGLAQQQAQQQAQIQAGYGQLSGAVLGDIQGIDAAQRQEIADTYAQQQGNAAQSLVNRGLGNTTVANSIQRGLGLDNAKANIALSNQTAGLRAQYRSNLGLAGLGYAGQAEQQRTGLGQNQLGWMNSVSAPYPNVEGYQRLAMMQGALGARNNGLLGAGARAGAGTNSPFALPSRGSGVGGQSQGSLYGGINYGRETMQQGNPYARSAGGSPQNVNFDEVSPYDPAWGGDPSQAQYDPYVPMGGNGMGGDYQTMDATGGTVDLYSGKGSYAGQDMGLNSAEFGGAYSLPSDNWQPMTSEDYYNAGGE